MAKAVELERHLAASGIAGAPTIEQVRRCLRRTHLLQCSGQGYAARDIVASDVTNFFLALVASNQINNAPAAITLARASEVYAGASENCDPWPFDGVGRDATLGEFLDALFSGRVSSALEPGFNHWDMRFEFQITDGSFRQFSRLIFETGDLSHDVRFFGINSRIRDQMDARPDLPLPLPLPLPPQVDRICVVRTKFLRDLIAFTTGALNPEQAAEPVAIDADNPFSRHRRTTDGLHRAGGVRRAPGQHERVTHEDC
ncbi:MAG: hypothetical protein KGZ61_11540 [Sandarakinorhabdus sp.]|nr:hypothetical protein [Sandarakinorhabdus sp.]